MCDCQGPPLRKQWFNHSSDNTPHNDVHLIYLKFTTYSGKLPSPFLVSRCKTSKFTEIGTFMTGLSIYCIITEAAVLVLHGFAISHLIYWGIQAIKNINFACFVLIFTYLKMQQWAPISIIPFIRSWYIINKKNEHRWTSKISSAPCKILQLLLTTVGQQNGYNIKVTHINVLWQHAWELWLRS